MEGRGGALLSGLHDHYVHLVALTAEAASVRVGPADVSGCDGRAAALRGGAPGEWIRAVGYPESVAGCWTGGCWTGSCLTGGRSGCSTAAGPCGSSTALRAGGRTVQ